MVESNHRLLVFNLLAGLGIEPRLKRACMLFPLRENTTTSRATITPSHHLLMEGDYWRFGFY